MKNTTIMYVIAEHSSRDDIFLVETDSRRESSISLDAAVLVSETLNCTNTRRVSSLRGACFYHVPVDVGNRFCHVGDW